MVQLISLHYEVHKYFNHSIKSDNAVVVVKYRYKSHIVIRVSDFKQQYIFYDRNIIK